MNSTRMTRLALATAMALTVVALGAPLGSAAEIRIGEPHRMQGLAIGALYLQAVKMDMGDMSASEAKAAGDHGASHGGMAGHGGHGHEGGDAHLEADIKAVAGNPWGFPEGAWIPYLSVQFEVKKQGSDWRAAGMLMPMAASNGPHYGTNLDFDGPGKYKVSFTVEAPDPAVFPRHFDRETGIADWWQPFTVSWDFVYVGTGKKGGY